MKTITVEVTKPVMSRRIGMMIHNAGGTTGFTRGVIAGWKLYDHPELAAKRATVFEHDNDVALQYYLSK